MKKNVFYIVILLRLSFIATKSLLYSQNSLINNQNWLVTKRQSKMLVNGGDEFLIDRPPLSENRIDLSRFFGNQEVVSKKEFNIEKLSFDFYFKELSKLDFTLQDKSDKVIGFHFQAIEEEGFRYVRSQNGKFNEIEKIPNLKLVDQWNHLSIERSESGFHIYINEGKISTIDEEVLKVKIGLRGGFEPILVDNIYVKELGGAEFIDGFENNKNFWKFYLLNMILFAGVFEIISSLLMLATKPSKRKTNLRLYLSSQVLVCISIFYVFDYYYLSKHAFFSESKYLLKRRNVNTSMLESLRYHTFDNWAKVVGAKADKKALMEKDYGTLKRIWEGPTLCSGSNSDCKKIDLENVELEVDKNKECYKILVLGTSQSIGAGASSIDTAIFSRFHKILASKLKNRCLISLNISKSAGKLEWLYEDLTQNYNYINPDLMIVNISSNDNPESLEANLPNLINYILQKKIKTVFIEEANYVFYHGYDMGLREKHKILRKYLSETNFRLLPFHDYMIRQYSAGEGNIWWDVVHMTDYGHEIAAKWIYLKLSESNFIEI